MPDKCPNHNILDMQPSKDFLKKQCGDLINRVNVLEADLSAVTAVNADLKRRAEVAEKALEIFARQGPCIGLHSDNYDGRCHNVGCSLCSLVFAYALAESEVGDE
jgi:hypothetical protein